MPPASTSTAPSKEALAIIVDVSHTMTVANMDAVKQTCNDFILQKMLFSPSDEIGILFAGTSGTKNRLNQISASHFHNITVMRPVMKPTGSFLSDVGAAVAEGGPVDMFESILCAADLISEATGDKKYNRRIMLISKVADQVKNKKAIHEVQKGLAAAGISLVVIGVDFTVTDDQDWSALTTTKQQNERVLSIMCNQLGDESFIFPIADAMEALHSLRKRNVSERTTSRAVLTIGDIKIAVYLFTKTLQARVPTLKKTSSAAVADSNVTIDRRYFVANTMHEVDPSERIKVLKYGRSVVPCASVDEEQMKFVSDRSLDCLGFVNMTDIPPHILMGGCKAVGPAIGDGEGATALAAVVQGMVHLGKAMLVRHVRCANASPTVCACFPSAKPDRHILYMVTLPYAEDFRRYLLPDFADVALTPQEGNAIDDMVTAMMLPEPAAGDNDDDDEVEGALKLNKIYNPSLQQYYAWVRARYLQTREAVTASGGSPAAASAAVGKPLPAMPDAVKLGATCWGEKGNCLHNTIAASKGKRDRVAELFPFVPPNAANAPGAAAKGYWFGQQGGVSAPIVSVSSGEPSASRGLRTESGVPNHHQPSASDHYLSTTSGTQSQATLATSSSSSHQPSSNTTSVSGGGLLAAAAGNGGGGPSSARAITAINTANPVESFLAMVNNKAIDQVDEAIFRMGELVLTLLKLSIGAQFYGKCEQCVRALRRVCIDEDEPAAYYSFLQRLMLIAKGGAMDGFWTHHVVANGLGPITMNESPASVMTPQEAGVFMHEGIKAPIAPIMDDEQGGDELLDLLE